MNQGVDATIASLLERIIAVALVIVLSIIANFIAKRIILRVITKFISHTKTTWDDILLKRKVFNHISHFAPALLIYFAAPLVLEGYDHLLAFTTDVVLIYMIVIGLLVIDSILNAFQEIYQTFEVAREIPVKGFIQILKIAIFFIGIIFILSVIFDRTPLYLLSGLGALTAVLMLIFKDSVLGFVAGIQLISNKMLVPGDWIEMPKYGADGDVVDVSLTTVKVRNWDKTITTIPTYALISESFKNWRGMSESGGRRIKRSVYIDINSIKFCNEKCLNVFPQYNISRNILKGKEKR